jgi:hypothetical protein
MRPPLTSSRPAIILSRVDFPHPEGPTRTTNSPSPISSVTSSTATMPPEKTFETFSSSIFAMSILLDAERRA